MTTKRTILATIAAMATLMIASPAWAVDSHSSKSCASCHVPHSSTGDNTQVPLWNPAHSTLDTMADSTGYSRFSMDASIPDAPDGASLLCLSCHDGTYDHVSSEHTFNGLANSHPVSIEYPADGVDAELVSRDSIKTSYPDVLDGLDKVQCTSCHDVHQQAATGKSTSSLVQDTDGNGAAVDTDGDGNFTNDLNTSVSNNDGHYLRWSYNLNYPSTDGKDFCNKCHIK